MLTGLPWPCDSYKWKFDCKLLQFIYRCSSYFHFALFFCKFKIKS